MQYVRLPLLLAGASLACQQQGSYCGQRSAQSKAYVAVQLDRLVEDVLRITELQPLRNRLVGTPDSCGLDGTHFAHFVVAAELMLNPSVLLCGAFQLIFVRAM